MNPLKSFYEARINNIKSLSLDNSLKAFSIDWIVKAAKHNYAYNFDWLGRPIIQLPQDIIALHELIWSIKPDIIIETGIAHGGSLIFSASQLIQLDVIEAFEKNIAYEPKKSKRKVIGIDIDIRKHNRNIIEKHPFSAIINLIEGSSTDANIIENVHSLIDKNKKVLVILDSNHTHDHVLNELISYSEFVTLNSYIVVLDSLIEDLPAKLFENNLWGPGNNPKTAIHEFLKTTRKFVIDKDIESKLVLTVAPDGYLKRVL